jgi:uncharacterized protein (TIGR02598 family)
MTCRHPLSAGFSLVEVTLSLGVAAFCLIALLGLLPLGIQLNQSAISQTAAASVLSSIVADLRSTPKERPTSRQYDITFGSAKLIYLDDEGRAALTPTDLSAPRYRVTITFLPSPPGTFAPSFANLKVTWPALADPTITTPDGSVEMFAAFDRH